MENETAYYIKGSAPGPFLPFSGLGVTGLSTNSGMFASDNNDEEDDWRDSFDTVSEIDGNGCVTPETKDDECDIGADDDTDDDDDDDDDDDEFEFVI